MPTTSRFLPEFKPKRGSVRLTVSPGSSSSAVVGDTSTGTVYWEGLSELLDARGQRVGLGYLELTGYAGTLKM